VHLSEQLKILAKGINPDTGELLDGESVVNTPEAIRLLFSLSDELADYEKPKKRKNKLTPEERRNKNISEGRPAKSHFPWSEEERAELTSQYTKNSNISELAKQFERSKLAIAVQLEKAGLISEEQVTELR